MKVAILIKKQSDAPNASHVVTVDLQALPGHPEFELRATVEDFMPRKGDQPGARCFRE
jgi:hypothetical protein